MKEKFLLKQKKDSEWETIQKGITYREAQRIKKRILAQNPEAVIFIWGDKRN